MTYSNSTVSPVLLSPSFMNMMTPVKHNNTLSIVTKGFLHLKGFLQVYPGIVLPTVS